MSTEKITEQWLREVGFKWSQIESQFGRQLEKHWILWLGEALREPGGERRMFSSYEDLGIEVAGNYTWHNGVRSPEPEEWFCWLHSACSHRYHRFIHIRHILFQSELIQIVEALTGQKWDPANNVYGSMVTPERAAHLRQREQRLDQVIQRAQHPWTEHEKDETRCRPRIEHVDAAIKGGLAK